MPIRLCRKSRHCRLRRQFSRVDLFVRIVPTKATRVSIETILDSEFQPVYGKRWRRGHVRRRAWCADVEQGKTPMGTACLRSGDGDRGIDDEHAVGEVEMTA
jgi:hypothetical protein